MEKRDYGTLMLIKYTYFTAPLWFSPFSAIRVGCRVSLAVGPSVDYVRADDIDIVSNAGNALRVDAMLPETPLTTLPRHCDNASRSEERRVGKECLE